jgi:hypothetical protein
MKFIATRQSYHGTIRANANYCIIACLVNRRLKRGFKACVGLDDLLIVRGDATVCTRKLPPKALALRERFDSGHSDPWTFAIQIPATFLRN